MQIQSSPAQKIYAAIIAMLGWFALIAQFYININSGVAETPEIIIRFFSYFTITTNLIVALCCTMLVFKQNGFLTRQKTLTAAVIYILIVCVIYNSILRALWKPEGLQKIVDELLHTIIPVLFLIYWLIFVAKNKLGWKDILPWMIYPVVYLIFVLVRGTYSGFYPYPFLDVDTLGFQTVLFHCAGIAVAFIFLSLLFVGVANFTNKGFLHD